MRTVDGFKIYRKKGNYRIVGKPWVFIDMKLRSEWNIFQPVDYTPALVVGFYVRKRGKEYAVGLRQEIKDDMPGNDSFRHLKGRIRPIVRALKLKMREVVPR